MNLVRKSQTLFIGLTLALSGITLAGTFMEVFARSSTRLKRTTPKSKGDFRVAIFHDATPQLKNKELRSFILRNFKPPVAPSTAFGSSPAFKPLSVNKTRVSRLFNNKDIVVLIDKSSSMKTVDTNASMSRWQWAGNQLRSLAYNLNFAPLSNLDVVLFDNKVKKYNSVSIKSLSTIFSNNTPSGGTNVTKALKGELNQFFARKSASASYNRPLIVAVITDGAPSSSRSLKDLIVNATHKLDHKGQLKISFLQIGQESQGNKLLPELDHGLVSDGALFDIVDSKPFYEVERKGLVNVLLDVVSRS